MIHSSSCETQFHIFTSLCRFCVGDRFFLKNNMILCQLDYEGALLNGSAERQPQWEVMLWWRWIMVLGSGSESLNTDMWKVEKSTDKLVPKTQTWNFKPRNSVPRCVKHMISEGVCFMWHSVWMSSITWGSFRTAASWIPVVLQWLRAQCAWGMNLRLETIPWQLYFMLTWSGVGLKNICYIQPPHGDLSILALLPALGIYAYLWETCLKNGISRSELWTS